MKVGVVKYLNFWMVIVLVNGIVILGGCTSSDTDSQDTPLIRVRDSVVTIATFKQTFELSRIDYDVADDDKSSLSELRKRILNQLVEETIIRERAKDLDIMVSDETLEAGIQAIKRDYPDNTFEEVFLENAVSFSDWRERFRTRLLLEMVVKEELNKKVEITPEDITSYYEKHYQNSDEKPYPFDEYNNINESIVKQLKRDKAEQSYKNWIDQLYTEYGVEINWDLFRTIDASLER